LKNVVVNVAHPDGTKSPLVIGVPGDREVDLKRVEAQLSPLEIEPFTDEDFAKHPKLVRGYIGAEILGADSGSGIRYVLDPRVANGTSWVTGANEFGKHRINVVAGRDFTPDQLVDAVEVHAGDPCPECGKDLRIDRGIEIGHVFQLGKKYAEALDLKVLDQNGKTQVVTMGSYGIGVSRVVAAIAEATHDEIGLCWPRNIAPADVHVVTTGKNGDDLFVAAEKFATELESRGLTVIFDDRNGVSPGVKFKDAELLGMPVIAVVGKKFESGHIEVRERKSGIQHEVPIEDAINTVVSISKGH
jgi:prolyl-tRNA synthetase